MKFDTEKVLRACVIVVGLYRAFLTLINLHTKTVWLNTIFSFVLLLTFWCLQPQFVRKTVFFFLVLLSAWTLTKYPFFIAFDPNGDDYYDKIGLEGSINLGHWIHGNGGYHGTKLKTPAVNFILVHTTIGITVLILIASTIIKNSWRRKYGHVTYFFTMLLGLHTLPAALAADNLPQRIIFTFTCILVIAAALRGFHTLSHYDDKERSVSEKRLAWEHFTIAFGAWGAGFAEIFFVYLYIVRRVETGSWPDTGDNPHPLAGKTIYDKVPSCVGWTVFVTLITVVWVGWPMYVLQVETPTTEETATAETSRLMCGSTTNGSQSIPSDEESRLPYGSMT